MLSGAETLLMCLIKETRSINDRVGLVESFAFDEECQLEALMELYNDPEQPDYIKAASCEAMGALGLTAAQDFLMETASYQPIEIARGAIWGLGRLAYLGKDNSDAEGQLAHISYCASKTGDYERDKITEVVLDYIQESEVYDKRQEERLKAWHARYAARYEKNKLEK